AQQQRANTSMQDLTDAERHRIKGLDTEAKRLDKVNELDAKAGLNPNGDKQILTEFEKQRRIETMERIHTQYRVSGPRFHFKDQPDRIAFRDLGSKMKTASNDQRVARSMAMMADAKGWKTLTVSGHPDFQREVWLEARLRGLEVKGFKPRQEDLEALKTAQERQMGNVVERGPEKERASADRNAPVDRSEQPQTAARQSDKRDGPERTSAASVAALGVIAGIVVAHGRANYNNDPQEKQSYYVKLDTPTGERTVWGKDLERAMATSKASKGDQVQLEYKGSETVTVNALKRDKAGKVVGSEQVETNRNAWEVKKTERERVVEAVASAVIAKDFKNPAARQAVQEAMDRKIRERAKDGTLPPVKVFDKTAPAKNRDAERTGPVVERNAERSR
ncbi:hypothetical protein LXM94_24585, partial [Rhizobium sp. TRM95111]|uniref:LPD7 domain-containing protein n=1 Tax=Rhizobium alarense TaxID=2846851 RepID=UPI001F1BEC8D